MSINRRRFLKRGALLIPASFAFPAIMRAATVVVIQPAVVSAPFTPTDISGLQLWLKADSGVEEATDDPAENADTVARWLDQSGNNYHATEATNQPTYITGAYNSLPCVRFDGSNDQLALTSGLGMARNVAGFTFVAVLKMIAAGSGEKDVFAVKRSGSSSQTRATLMVSYPTAGKWGFGGRRLDADSGDWTASATSVNTSALTLTTVVLDYANSNSAIYLNGSTTADASDTAFQTDGNTSDTDSNSIHIGSAGGGSFSNVDLCETCWYNSALSEANRTALANYLKAKWGIA